MIVPQNDIIIVNLSLVDNELRENFYELIPEHGSQAPVYPNEFIINV